MIKGILNFLHWLDKPAIISEEDIFNLRLFFKSHEIIWVEKTGIDVPMRKKVFLSESLPEKEKIRINLPTLGYTLVSHSTHDNTSANRKKSEQVSAA